MTKDDLLEFLDRVGARSLELYLCQESDDPQVGLDERLDWARSRLADPRYSRAARFLVSHESEIRAILREGEQPWLHRQLTGAVQTMPPIDEADVSTVIPGMDDLEAPPPPITAPQMMDSNEAENPVFSTEGMFGPEPEPVLEPEPEISFVSPLMFESDADGPSDGLDLLADDRGMDLLATEQDPYDIDSEPTMVARRSMLPIEALRDIEAAAPQGDASPDDSEPEFTAPPLFDPATEAVEGDWDGGGMGAFMPSVQGRPAPLSEPIVSGNLFEDVLGDQDTHASFDTSTSPPPGRGNPTLLPPPTPPPAPKSSGIPRDNVTFFADDLPPERTPPPMSPIPSANTGVSSRTPVTQSLVQDGTIEPDALPRENTASTRFVPTKKKKKRRYDPFLLLAMLALAVSVAFLVLSIMGRTGGSTDRPVSAQVLVQNPAPVPVTPTPTPTPLPAEPMPTTDPVPVEVAPTPVPPAPVAPQPTPAPVRPDPVAPSPVPVAPVPAPVAPAPVPAAPAPVPVAPAPVPVAPKPVPVAPTPVPVAPTPVPVAPAPVPVAPAPPAPVASLNPAGSWAGTAGSGALALKLEEGKAGKISGTARLTVAGAPRHIAVDGTFDTATGKLALAEVDGALTFSGTVTATTAQGTWSPGAGSTARQWFVVRKD